MHGRLKKTTMSNLKIPKLKFLARLSVPEVDKEAKGTTVGYVLSGAVPIGVFSLSDTCRTGAAEAVTTLKRMGIKTAMLTGDSVVAAGSAQNQARFICALVLRIWEEKQRKRGLFL